MLRPLIVIRRIPSIDFMRWHRLGFALLGAADASARSCCS